MEAVQQVVNNQACDRQQTYICASEEGFEKAVAPSSDDEGTTQSTEPGDRSTADVSDYGEEISRNSDASDSEAVPNESIQAVPSPQQGSIAPPPGLELPPRLTVETRSRLSSSAPLFVPSFTGLAVSMPVPAQDGGPWNVPVETPGCTPPGQEKSKQRKTISLLNGLPTEAEVPSPVQAEAEEAEALIALQEAVSQLTPGASAMLRAFLDSKDLGHTNPAMLTAAPAAAALGPLAPPPATWTQSRPYTPFGCKPSARGAEGKGRTRSKSRSKTVTAAPDATTQPTANDAKETLRSNLRTLKALGRERVVGVRKMNRLGFKSPEILEAYFSKFGSVDRVMVSHSHAKSMFGRRVRVRPAGLGFVVMSSAEEAQAVLKAGAEHEIKDCIVSVYPFESCPVENADSLDHDPEDC